MELKLEKREPGKKNELGRIRRNGDIPAVLYVRGKESVAVTLSGGVFAAHLRAIPKGGLATQFFSVEYEGRTFKAIVKDIDYHRTTYNIVHLDLMEVNDSDRISVNIPVTCRGVENCVGITQGGQLKKVKRSVPVTVQVAETPKQFELDVSGLNLGDSMRVRDILLTPSMKLRLNQNQVLVAVSK